MKACQAFEFCKTPDIIVNLGAERLPVIMTQDVMKRITKDKHNVTIDNVKNLYSAISEPIWCLTQTLYLMLMLF